MPHIVIVSAAFPPEPVVSARMSRDLALHLLGRGHRVTVLCPQPSRPESARYEGYRSDGEILVADEDGVEVVRLPSFAAPQSAVLPRLKESWSYGHHVCRYLAACPAPDALYVNAWPLLAQALVASFAVRKKVPMVLQVMDVYPEALTGKLPSLPRLVVHTPLKWLDRSIAKSAASVVVISDNMSRTYTEDRRVPVERVVTIPTWQDESVYEGVPSRDNCCNRYGIPQNPFTFLYLGNIGPVAGVDFVIRAFAEFNMLDAQLVIVGEGAAKADCVALTSRLNLGNVHFVSDPEPAHVPFLQGMAHVCILPMKCGSGMSSVPSKLPAYMFSAKPVIATVDRDSDTARFVNKAKCGWVGDAEDLNWLVARMKEVSGLPKEQLEAIGQRGKIFGLANFSKSSGVVCLADTILKVAGTRK